MPTPQLNGNSPAIKAASKPAYGEIPGKQSSDPRVPAKSQSFPSPAPNAPSQQYGKVPLRGSGGIPAPTTNGTASSSASSNKSSSNYAPVLRAGGAERIAEDPDYGGLPDNGSDYGGLPEESADDYGGLPDAQDDPDYGGLPQQDNDYGGLPQQEQDYGGLPQQDNDYGGLPQQDNDYGGLPQQGAVLPHDNIRVPFGATKHVPQQDNDYGGLPSSPTSPSSPRSQYGGMPSRNNQRLSLHRSASNQ